MANIIRVAQTLENLNLLQKLKVSANVDYQIQADKTIIVKLPPCNTDNIIATSTKQTSRFLHHLPRFIALYETRFYLRNNQYHISSLSTSSNFQSSASFPQFKIGVNA